LEHCLAPGDRPSSPYGIELRRPGWLNANSRVL